MDKPKSRIIAICNQKGGTAKTSTAINLSVALAKQGKKVMVVDLDGQSHTTIGFGYEPEKLCYTISDLIHKYIIQNDDEEISFNKDDYILKAEGIDIFPCDKKMSGVETELINAINRYSILKEILTHFINDYEYILIDCPPALGNLTLNALTAANSVIIPVQAHYYPLRGMEDLLQSIMRVRKHLNSSLEIDGILLSMYDCRTTLSKEIKTAIEQIYKDKINIFNTTISTSTKVAEAPSQGKSIFSHAPNSRAAQEFKTLAKEVLGCPV